ncbi:hypothetical protein C8Q77DRAFT_1076030 [Trametes polyzona]|nr:hypothetical protein C8Q77DRAFT_1076030 [Trametes polyzona]
MTWFPLPATYAVVELDVEKTLQPFNNDPIAVAAAANIRTTKCILYLDVIPRLPFPQDETFKYMAHIIGPGLRPADPELLLTPDMSIPIFPNTEHPSHVMAPLVPYSPFPYGNCYHWIGPDTTLDLRIWNDGIEYPKEERVALPARQHVRMENIRAYYLLRNTCALNKAAKAAEAKATPPVESVGAPTVSSTTASSPRASEEASAAAGLSEVLQEPNGCERAPCPADVALPESPSVSAKELHEELDEGPAPSSNAPRSDPDGSGQHREGVSVDDADCGSEWSSSAEDAPDGPSTIDIFGLNFNERDQLLPIVRMWPDVGAQFASDDEVPNPMDFVRQYKALVTILTEAQGRAIERAALVQAEHVRESLSEDSTINGNAEAVSVETTQTQGFWMRMAKISRSLFNRSR